MTRTPYDDIVSLSRLSLTRVGEGRALEVPLVPADMSRRDELHLYEGGVVWEDEEIALSFELETRVPVKRASLAVNDHNELYMLTTWTDRRPLGGIRTFGYHFEVDRTQSTFLSRLPFSLSCGLACVTVHIFFSDGREARFESYDIVCLDEPTPGREELQSAEEDNVRAMYRTLMQRVDNQPSEWMFAQPDGSDSALSDDDDTDWAFRPLDRMLSTASAALDLSYDGIEDAGVGEKTRLSDADVLLVQAARTLIRSIALHASEAARTLGASCARRQALLARLRALVIYESRLRGRPQSLPVDALIEEQLAQERLWLAPVHDLVERAEMALTDLNELVGVSSRDALVSDRESMWEAARGNEQLAHALDLWGEAQRAEELWHDAALYAIRPDRLFEYFALHRLLGGLYDLGFREKAQTGDAISRYAYRLSEVYRKYVNEQRCANTYHLMRTVGGATQEVSLYYQPVIYAHDEPENGICLRRVGELPEPDGPADAVWTPDFLVTVRDEGGQRWYALDAKYTAWHTLVGPEGKLAACVDKYLVRTRVMESGASEALVEGVWVLAGRLDDDAHLVAFDPVGEGLVSEGVLPVGCRATCGIVPFDSAAEPEHLWAFLGRLGFA